MFLLLNGVVVDGVGGAGVVNAKMKKANIIILQKVLIVTNIFFHLKNDVTL